LTRNVDIAASLSARNVGKRKRSVSRLSGNAAFRQRSLL